MCLTIINSSKWESKGKQKKKKKKKKFDTFTLFLLECPVGRIVKCLGIFGCCLPHMNRSTLTLTSNDILIRLVVFNINLLNVDGVCCQGWRK